MTIVPDTYHLTISIPFSPLSASPFPWDTLGYLYSLFNLYLVENSINCDEEYWVHCLKQLFVKCNVLQKSPSTVQSLNMRLMSII